MFGARRNQCGFAVMSFFVVLSTGCGVLFGPPSGDIAVSPLAEFSDPDSGFSTSDVYDVDNQIVRFDTEAKSIIWAEDGRAFQAGMWEVDGNILRPGMFQVRFGNAGDQRRAYFTETGRGTICDLNVVADELQIIPTDTQVPQ